MDETTRSMFREDDPQAAAELLGKLERGSQAAWRVPEQAWARHHQVMPGASDMARELHDQLLDAQHWTVESRLREPGESARQFAERYQVGAEADEPEWDAYDAAAYWATHDADHAEAGAGHEPVSVFNPSGSSSGIRWDPAAEAASRDEPLAREVDTDEYGPYPTRAQRSREAGWRFGDPDAEAGEAKADPAEPIPYELTELGAARAVADQMTEREVGLGYLGAPDAEPEAGQ